MKSDRIDLGLTDSGISQIMSEIKGNQKKMLQAYARENHMGNTKFYVDDGYTGTNFAGVR